MRTFACRLSWLAVAAWILTLCACSEPDEPTDAGLDASAADAGTDSGVSDAGTDSGVPDAAADSGVSDAASDSSIPDGGPDACVAHAESCDGVDDDCDGLIDNLATAADLQQGVCTGLTKICAAGVPAEPDYSATSGYEPTELSCDGLDNDCDGRTDLGAGVTGQSAGCAASGCEEIARLSPGGAAASYWVSAPGAAAPVEVTCDSSRAGGGWTVLFDVCGGPAASLEQPLNPTLASLPVGQIHLTTIDGRSAVVRFLEQERQTVGDLYADPFVTPTAGATHRTKRLGDGLDLFDDGDCESPSGTVPCTNLFAASNVMDPTSGHGYGCRDAATCLSAGSTFPRYLDLVCRLMVRSTDFAAVPTAESCRSHLAAGRRQDGVYTIDPDGVGAGAPFRVWCDMTTSGGGWTLITSIDANAALNTVDSSQLITPYTSNATDRGMNLPGASEILIVNDGRDDAEPIAYDKAERFSSVTGLSLSWEGFISALNVDDGGTWSDLDYSTGSDDAWQFTVESVNTEGCVQTPLRASYGDGNYGGFNGEGYAPPGALYIHWGAETWMAGTYGNIGPTSSDYAFGDLRCNTSLYTFTRFWHGTYLR